MGASMTLSQLTERRRRLLSILVALSLGVTFLVAVPTRAAAAPCDAPVVNEIACENTKTGNPSSEWNITGSGTASIQGFATDISVNRGATIGFKVKTTRRTIASTSTGWATTADPEPARSRPST